MGLLSKNKTMGFCPFDGTCLELEVRNGARLYCPLPGCKLTEEMEILKNEKGEDAGSTDTQTSSVSENKNVPVKKSLNESEPTVESELRVGEKPKLANEELEDGVFEPEYSTDPEEELSEPEDPIDPEEELSEPEDPIDPEEGLSETEDPIDPEEQLSEPEDVVEPQLAEKDFFNAFEDDFDDSDIN